MKRFKDCVCYMVCTIYRKRFDCDGCKDYRSIKGKENDNDEIQAR